MASIVLKNFKGMVPAISPKRLPINFGQVAENCALGSGRLSPVRALAAAQLWDQATVGDLRSLYKYGSNFLFWLESEISVVRGEVPSGNDRLFYSGNGYPKQTDTVLMPSTGRPTTTADYRRLGVTPPSAALTIHGPSGTGDGVVAKTVSYYYTLVSKWSDGTEEESKPSPASAIQDIEGGEYLSLSNFVIPTLAGSGNNITHVRLYRLESGSVGGSYQLLQARPGSATATGVYDIPIASVPNSATQVYDTDGTPAGLNDNVDEQCPTEGWSPAPDNLKQLRAFHNGMFGGLSGDTFRVSEPFYWYAWDPNHKVTMAYEPVAWGSYRGMAIIATTAYPYIITGVDPESLQGEPLLYEQGCLSARGFIVTPIGVIYPSPDGLVLINEKGLVVLTKDVLEKKQWDDLPPSGFTHADLVSFYYDETYFGFWEGSAQGFSFDFTKDPYIKTIYVRTLSGDDGVVFGSDDVVFGTDNVIFGMVPLVFHDGCIDPVGDTLYLLTYLDAEYGAHGWETHTSNFLPLKFMSRKEVTEPTNFAYGLILGDQTAGKPVVMTIYGDGVQIKDRLGDDWSKSVVDENIFTLPKTSEYELTEVELVTQADVDAVILATSPDEIMDQVEALDV
ncbi:MAG: hypothetical protein HGJ94_18310 [Desulfosarcina sp.]|nr:hypothetical protein [Desulfosarcina sp.]